MAGNEQPAAHQKAARRTHDRSHPLRLCLGGLSRRRGRAQRFWACGPSNRCRGPRSAYPASRCCSCCCRRWSCRANQSSGAACRSSSPSGCSSRLADAADRYLNQALGPVITSTLGNLAPLFAVATAVALLHEPLHPPQLLGLVVAVAGAAIITVTRPRDLGHWRSWALLLPLCSALVRGIAPPVVNFRARSVAEPVVGLPDRLPHVLAGGAGGAARPQGQLCRRCAARRAVLVCDDRDQQRPERCCRCSLPSATARSRWWRRWRRSIPLVTVALSAMVLKHIAITARIVAGTALTVLGVALVLVG